MRIKIDKNDILFSKMVRERAGNKCVFCGKNGSEWKLEASHFWGRGNKVTRFYGPNVDCLCFYCHSRHEGNKQGYYRAYKLATLKKEKYDELEKLAISIGKYGAFQKKEINEILKKQYNNKEHLQEDWVGVLSTSTLVFI